MDKLTKIKFNILAVIAIIIFCFAITPKTFQNDTFYTIKIGEHIVNNGIDMKDPFSWHEDLPYTYPHWLFDLTTYFIYSMTGYAGVYGVTILLAITLGLSMYIVNVKLNKNHFASFIVTMLIMYTAQGYIAARAQLVTFILFIWTIYNIERYIEDGKKINLIMLFIIPTVIANVHVAVWPFYFVLFLPYVVEYIVYKFEKDSLFEKILRNSTLNTIKSNEEKLLKLEKIKNKTEKKQKQIEGLKKEQERLNKKIEKINKDIEKAEAKKEQEENPEEENDVQRKISLKPKKYQKYLIFIMLAAVLTAFITPLGAKTTFTYLPKTLKGTTTQSIMEHQPTVLINQGEFLSIIMVIVLLLTFTRLKLSLRDYFMLGGLLLMALISQRQISLFIIIGSIIFVRGLCYLFDKYDVKEIESIAIKMTGLFGKVITLGIVILVSVFLYKPKIKSEYIAKKNYPVHAAEWIKENLDYQNIRLYNEYNYGSYLLLNDIPVFIDSRCDLYAPEYNGSKNDEGEYEGRNIFEDFMSISSMTTHYEEILEKYNITHVILLKSSKMNVYVEKDLNYDKLYEDENFAIYERNIKHKSAEIVNDELSNIYNTTINIAENNN